MGPIEACLFVVPTIGFKVFTCAEGGYYHCQIDNQSICSAYMWDWLEDVLQPVR